MSILLCIVTLYLCVKATHVVAMPILSRTLQHQYITILDDGDLLIQTSTTAETERYSPYQVHLFVLFDSLLRDLHSKGKELDLTKYVVPGGYDMFVFGFNLDTTSPYGFVRLDPESRRPLDEDARRAVPYDLILPRHKERLEGEAFYLQFRERYEQMSATMLERSLDGTSKAQKAYRERTHRRERNNELLLPQGGRGKKSTAVASKAGRTRSASPVPRAPRTGKSSSRTNGATKGPEAGPSKGKDGKSAAAAGAPATPTGEQDVIMEKAA